MVRVFVIFRGNSGLRFSDRRDNGSSDGQFDVRIDRTDNKNLLVNKQISSNTFDDYDGFRSLNIGRSNLYKSCRN